MGIKLIYAYLTLLITKDANKSGSICFIHQVFRNQKISPHSVESQTAILSTNDSVYCRTFAQGRALSAYPNSTF